MATPSRLGVPRNMGQLLAWRLSVANARKRANEKTEVKDIEKKEERPKKTKSK